jgi:hypothetical protein
VSGPAAFSDEFEHVAREEAERLRVRALELRARSGRWADRARELAEEAERLESRVRHLDELLGRAPQLRLDLQSKTLQGQQLREEAVRILVEKRGAREPIHYRDWYGLLREEGLAAVGKDPVATFLTQITRSPVVERVEGQAGVYQVDPAGAYERARSELARAAAELSTAQESLASQAEGAPADAHVVGVREAQERLAAAQRRFDAILRARSVVSRDRRSAVA